MSNLKKQMLDVVKRTKMRNLELENLIFKDPYYSYMYASFTNHRFLKCEPYLAISPTYLQKYVFKILKERSIQYEKIVLNNNQNFNWLPDLLFTFYVRNNLKFNHE